jgi:nucleotidyltransferase/DNA polymerase involved in DNA repair
MVKPKLKEVHEHEPSAGMKKGSTVAAKGTIGKYFSNPAGRALVACKFEG